MAIDAEDIRREQLVVDKIKSELRFVSCDDISYLQGTLGGPKNKMRREQKYGYNLRTSTYDKLLKDLYEQKLGDKLIEEMLSEEPDKI